MISRRSLVGMVLAAALADRADAAARGAPGLKAIQKKTGGRLGVHIVDSQSGRRITIDDDARFAMASTCKLPLAAALLWQVDKGAFPLTHALPIERADMIPNSPIMEKELATGVTEMTVRDLCTAAVTYSDNAATNVLLKGIGGPTVLTAFIRSIGDQVTRFDRTEPELNSNIAGDERDTTTPHAMAENMLKIFTQDVLSLGARALLIDWMIAARTGVTRARAGLPKNWQTGDKTGTGQNGAVNDLVITWPPNRRPIIAAIYMSESPQSVESLSTAHSEIGALIGREKWP